MLPVKAGSLKLSDESRMKLDLYYRRFCEGENGKLYGISHMVFACHAAFPMILSPALTNLLWLNFNTFIMDDTVQKIERVVVSDFMLSPLLRPVANRQFEMIPEIRNYLLYLLKDGRWFQLFGVETAGALQLVRLAQFLQQYLADKKSNAENNASGFAEVNKWAALAYLNPDKLAQEIAAAFNDTFRGNNSGIDEHGQLRLNMLMDRFGQQIDLNIHSNEVADTAAFMNLQLYSKANKARLFEKPSTDVEDILMNLDGTYISSDTADKNQITLPVQKGISKRLNRKKNNVQRIVSLLIGVDKYEESALTSLNGCVQGAKQIAAYLEHQNTLPDFDCSSISILTDEQATRENIIASIKDLYQTANTEDICLFYFSGHGTNDNYNENSILGSDYKSSGDSITNDFFRQLVQQYNPGFRSQTLVLMDTHTGHYNWAGPNDIMLGGVAHTLQRELKIGDHTSSIFLNQLTEILLSSPDNLTYKDLYRLLKFKMANNNAITDETPVLVSNAENLNKIFLTNKAVTQGNYFLLVYNSMDEYWHVIGDDFIVLPTNRRPIIYRDYDNVSLLNVKGEVFVRENKLLFGGLTNEMVKGKTYKLIPDKEVLYYELTWNDTVSLAERNEYESDVNNPISWIPTDNYSPWHHIEKVNSKKSAAAKLQIHVANTQNTIFEITYQPSANDNPFSWRAESMDILIQSFKKFTRYNYFSNLVLPSERNIELSPLDIKIYHWWGSRNTDSYQQQPKQDILMLDENCISIENGKIIFKPLTIQINSNESFLLFADVYLVLSECSIKKINSNNIKIEPEKQIQLEVKEDAIIEQLLLESITAQIKILFSRNPVVIDFSQTGINKI